MQRIVNSDLAFHERHIRIPFGFADPDAVVRREILRFRIEQAPAEIEMIVTSNVIVFNPQSRTYSVFYCQDYGSGNQYSDRYLLQDTLVIRPETDLGDSVRVNYSIEHIASIVDDILFPNSGSCQFLSVHAISGFFLTSV